MQNNTLDQTARKNVALNPVRKNELRKHLYHCLQREVIMNEKPFSWWRALHKALKCPKRRFNFWWRIASYLYHSGSPAKKQLAYRINRKLIQKYNTEIQLPAQIAPGLIVTHYLSVVINGCAVIGKNFKIRQNTTIGLSGRGSNHHPKINIGDNVEVGANSCIIGDNLRIGNNVTIGAMSFINKDIPDDSIVFTEKRNSIAVKKEKL